MVNDKMAYNSHHCKDCPEVLQKRNFYGHFRLIIHKYKIEIIFWSPEQFRFLRSYFQILEKKPMTMAPKA